MQVATDVWRYAKRWKVIPMGPVSVVFRLRRTARVSSNLRRRWLTRLRGLAGIPTPSPVLLNIRPPDMDTQTRTAMVVGVGPGLGEALVGSFAASGMDVALVSRNAARLDPLVAHLRRETGRRLHAYACDATLESSVAKLYESVVHDLGVPDLVVYSLQGFARDRALDVEVGAFEEHWRQNCLGAFIVAREAGRRMAARGHGTIVLVGSTSGVVARPDHLTLAVGKFGLRAMAHVFARELSPQGVHVVHLIIDGDIREDEAHPPEVPQLEPQHLADLIVSLHRQPRSTWTSELDVRPSREEFWVHC